MTLAYVFFYARQHVLLRLGVCLSVRLSVRHNLALYQKGDT